MQMTARQWAEWAANREQDATRVAALFKRQAVQVLAMLAERDCECDPIIVLPDGDMKGPRTGSPQVTHSMFCTTNK